MSAKKDEAPDPAPGSWTGFEDVPTEITVRIGGARCTLGRLAMLGSGEVVTLDRAVGRPFDLFANGIRVGGVQPVAAGDGIGIKLVDTTGDDGDAGN